MSNLPLVPIAETYDRQTLDFIDKTVSVVQDEEKQIPFGYLKDQPDIAIMLTLRSSFMLARID